MRCHSIITDRKHVRIRNPSLLSEFSNKARADDYQDPTKTRANAASNESSALRDFTQIVSCV
jgi:hypothetical protein